MSDLQSRFTCVSALFCRRQCAIAVAPGSPNLCPIDAINFHSVGAIAAVTVDSKITLEIDLGEGMIETQRLREIRGCAVVHCFDI